eukprot:11210264-Lingulodinium_polyedra.AAC.1
MGERGPASACPTRWAGALARACAAISGRATSQGPSACWYSATGMHQLWGARRVLPAGLFSSVRHAEGNVAA